MKADLQKEHEWLKQFVGEWTMLAEMPMGPDKPIEKHAGTERSRLIGGAWVICEGTGEMPGGGTAQSIMTLGYDPAKQRFVGTFLASVMTHLWVYNGTLDAAGKVLTLDTEGPDFGTPGKMAKYQDIIEFKSHDHRVMSSQVLGDDGKWTQIMTANYQRTK